MKFEDRISYTLDMQFIRTHSEDKQLVQIDFTNFPHYLLVSVRNRNLRWCNWIRQTEVQLTLLYIFESI